MIESKNSIVRRLVSQGEYKQALAICKDWDIGISKEDRDALRLGYECMVHSRFYFSLNYNIEECVEESIRVLIKLYG